MGCYCGYCRFLGVFDRLLSRYCRVTVVIVVFPGFSGHLDHAGAAERLDGTSKSSKNPGKTQ